MTSRVWIGDEWENHVRRLLLRRYAPGDYQDVPDRHAGDYGLEGFSSDGVAYQCYAPEEPLTTDERYKKCRNKITADLRKFVRNGSDIQRILGSVRIRRWVLITPRHDSVRLVQHCAAKAAEVLAARLPYVTDDFEVKVTTDEMFAVEAKELAGVGLALIDIAPPTIPENAPEEWLADVDNISLVGNLHRKSRAIHPPEDEQRRQTFVRAIATAYLRGQGILGELHDDYPELYERVYMHKSAREITLNIESLSGSSTLPGDRLKTEIAQLQTQISTTLEAMSPPTAAALALEAVADWLLRCPLDFAEA